MWIYIDTEPNAHNLFLDILSHVKDGNLSRHLARNPKLCCSSVSVYNLTQPLYGKIYKQVSKIQLCTWPEYPEVLFPVVLQGVKWKTLINHPLSSFPNPSQCILDKSESSVPTINVDIRPYKRLLFSHFPLANKPASFYCCCPTAFLYLGMSHCLFCLIPSTLNVLRASFPPQLWHCNMQ